MRMTGMALQVVRSDGVLALYNGLSASLCRQVPPAVPVPAPTCRAAQAGRGGLAPTWLCLLPTVGAHAHRSHSLPFEAAQEEGTPGLGAGRRGGRRAGGVGCAAPTLTAGNGHLQMGKPRPGFSSLWSG